MDDSSLRGEDGGQTRGQSGGGIGRGINTINNLVGFGKGGFNPLAGGSKAVTAAKFVAKGIARFMGPWIWAAVVPIFVAIVTFLMSMLTFFFQ